MITGSDVTVIIPTIPGRELLYERASASVATQTVAPYCVIAQIDINRRGAAWCRNEALTKVETPFISWLDDDDTFLPDHIESLVDGQNKSGADLVFTYAEFIGGRDPLACCQDGVLVAEPINVPFGPQQRDHLDSRQSPLCPWCGCHRGGFIPITHLVRTNLVREVGGFPEPNSMPEVLVSEDCEDYLLILQMLDAGGEFHHVLGRRTWQYHIHGANTAGRGVTA